MPKIAYIVHSLDPGGTERLAIDMAMAFQRWYDICILCLDEPGQWAPSAREAGIPVYSFYRQAGLDLTLPVGLAGFARRHAIDLFHAHQCTPWTYGGLARFLYPRVKLILEEHGRLYPETESWKRRYFNRLFLQPRTCAVTAVSEDVARRLVRYEGLRRKSIEVIYNGTGAAKLLNRDPKEALRRSFGLSNQDILVGTVGRLDPIKNLPLLLAGVARVKHICPNLKCLIVGEGPVRPALEALIAERGLSDTVILTGFRTDAATLVQLMDLFCLVSFSEGTSMALLESMAAGVPAIVSDAGGNPEIVVSEQTGWVIPSDDAAAFSKVLGAAVADKADRMDKGRAARKRFEVMFSFEAMVQQYHTLYRRVLKEA